jgi:hypothetical protein
MAPIPIVLELMILRNLCTTPLTAAEHPTLPTLSELIRICEIISRIHMYIALFAQWLKQTYAWISRHWLKLSRSFPFDPGLGHVIFLMFSSPG